MTTNTERTAPDEAVVETTVKAATVQDIDLAELAAELMAFQVRGTDRNLDFPA
jgi:hypothetical protein